MDCYSDDDDYPGDTPQVAALRRRSIATGHYLVCCSGYTGQERPCSLWLEAAIRTNRVDLADDLITAFGGAVLAPAMWLVGSSGPGAEWVESILPFCGTDETRAPCTRSFAAPGWWPPMGPAPLTHDQVVVMIETGDTEALRCAHAEGRLVAPVNVSSFQDQWIACALLALQPQIADWLLATFGSLVIPCDGGAYIDSRLWNHENPHVAVAANWLRTQRARLEEDSGGDVGE